MAKNVHRETQSLRWRQIAFAGFAVGLVVVLTVGLVLERQRHQRLGEQKAGLEHQARLLRSRRQALEVARSRLLARDWLLAQAARYNLGLTNVAPSQRLLIERPPAGAEVPRNDLAIAP